MLPLHKLTLAPQMKPLPRRKSITPEKDAAPLFSLCIIYLCKTFPPQRGMCNGRSVWVQVKVRVGNTGCGGENIKLESISVGLNASVQSWKMGSEHFLLWYWKCCQLHKAAPAAIFLFLSHWEDQLESFWRAGPCLSIVCLEIFYSSQRATDQTFFPMKNGGLKGLSEFNLPERCLLIKANTKVK